MIDPVRERMEAYTHFVNTFHIGEDVLYNDIIYHIQDVNLLSSTAKISIPDENNICWESIWVEFNKLTKVKNQETLVVEFPIIKNFPNKKPEGLNIETFPDVFPMKKP